MRIGELAERSGVSPRSLRYYEQRGLLVSRRSTSGQRTYDEAAVKRVGCLTALLRTGMSTAAILDVLPCMSRATPATALAAKTALLRERDRITATMADLVAARDALNELIDDHHPAWRSAK